MKETSGSVSFHIWNQEQCETVWKAVLKVLSETGCRVKCRRARELMEKAGCSVEDELVKIPEYVMRQAVDSAPKAFRIYDMNGKPAMELDGNHTYFGPPISTVFVRDPFTGNRRKGTRQDAYHAGLICEALPNVGWASAMSGISDGVSGLGDVYEVYELLQSTSKPIMHWAGSMENLRTEFQMLEAVAGGAEPLAEKPFSICLVCPMDPLVHNEDSLEQVMYLAERNAVPVYISGVSLGCTSPITIAGSVVVGIADSLVGLLVSQLVREGAPFIISRFCDTMNMRDMTIQRSRPEMVLANGAACDVFRYLGLPFCVNLGDTDSGVFDQAAAFDTAVSLYTGALGKASMNMSMGGFESANMSDYIGTVYGNEVVGYLTRILKGAEVNEHTLALEDIDEVGPGGNFLMMEDTFTYCHEFYEPDILVPRTQKADKELAQEGPEEKYRQRIRDIIQQGSRHTIKEETLKKLTAILQEAEKRAV